MQHWREAWGAHVNERLAELGIDARIDHRSYADQGITLEQQNKIGPAASRRPGQGLEAERIEDHGRIARENGEKIIADPRVALDAITRTQATFTTRDLAVFAFRHSESKEQYDRVVAAAKASPELVALGRDGRGDERFTSREMIATEARLERSGNRLAEGLRAERFMERWRALEAQAGGGDAKAIMARTDMIDGLRHDPTMRASWSGARPSWSWIAAGRRRTRCWSGRSRCSRRVSGRWIASLADRGERMADGDGEDAAARAFEGLRAEV